METGSHELAILSYATVCLHPSVSLNNEKNCREFSEHKIAVCEKTVGLRSRNSACLKVLVPVEIFQFSDMHYETERYRDSTDRLSPGIIILNLAGSYCCIDKAKTKILYNFGQIFISIFLVLQCFITYAYKISFRQL